MKALLTSLTLMTLLILSCKKSDPAPEPAPTPSPTPAADVTPPVITLTGNSVDTCYLGATYTDPGATANDNVDGNITASIVATGSVNSAATGTYLLNYNVKDAAGNSATQVTRTVKVMNSGTFLAGTYSVICTYTVRESAGPTTTVTTSSYMSNVQVSPSVNNAITINSLKIGPVSVVPYISSLTNNGNNISLMYVNTAYPFGSASGTVSPSKTSFTVDTYSYEQMFISRTHTCRNVFIKQ